MESNVVICGTGGQGVLSAGTLLAYAGMEAKKNVTWIPSYGAERRGGLSYSMVVISDEEIYSPIIANPIIIIGMDTVGLNVYEPLIKTNGTIILNTSLVKSEIKRKDVKVIKVPANKLAEEIGNVKVANIVAIGAYIKETNVVPLDVVIKSIKTVFLKYGEKVVGLDVHALKVGYDYI